MQNLRKRLALPRLVAPQQVNKRQREEQLEPVVPPTSEARLLGSDSFEASASPPHSHSFLFTSNSSIHPPLSIPFIEAYTEICRCESSLNACTTPSEIHDVLLDCFTFYHRIHDLLGMHPVLLERNQDLEHNIRLKQLRCCHQIIRSAAQVADDINLHLTHLCTHSIPSQLIIEHALVSTDEIIRFAPPLLQEPYTSNIRPILVRQWSYDSSSSACSLLSSSPSRSSVSTDEPEHELTTV
jgi:hypothetical protein